MATAPVQVDIPPGVVKSVSRLAALGRWIDADKVRFVNGRPEKWGGWTKFVSTQLDGLARGGYGWTALNRLDLLAFGTWRRMYSITSGVLKDITPLRASGNLTDPFSTSSGLPTVTVAHTTHGLEANAVVTFSGAAAVGGLTISGEYIVATVIGPDRYTITAGSNASGTAGPGGGTVAYTYALNPGKKDTVFGVGWGAGTWGAGTWGTPRAVSTIAIEMRFWSIHNYGTQLMVSPSGGSIYLWDQPGNAARAVQLANAPASCRFSFVTAERFVFALGTTTPMTVDWPDVNDPTNWTPALDNTADTRVLQDGNKLMAGCVFNDGINLIWSDTAVFIAQYLPGSDFIYDIAPARTAAGIVGAAAFCTTPMGVFWMSNNDLLLYDGSIRSAPNFVDMRDWLSHRIRRGRSHKIVLVYNKLDNEIQVHYPSVDSPDGENDSYLSCSLDTMSWVPGTMAGNWGHTARAVRRSPMNDIYFAHADGYIYLHENGTDADGAALPSYIESGPIALSAGLIDMDVIGYEPNFERQTGNIQLDVEAYDRPKQEQLGTPIDFATEIITPTDTLVDFLVGGRYVKHRLSTADTGTDWRLGLGIFETGPAGDSR